jgi:hypothetical protein
MSKADVDVGTGLVGAPACGDVMKLQIRVDPETQRIADVKFKTFGCGSAIASSSYLTELVQGMTLEEAGRIRNTEIAKELCLPPVKCWSCPLIWTFYTNNDYSALLNAGRGRHQKCHYKLLHKKSVAQAHRSCRDRSVDAKGRGCRRCRLKTRGWYQSGSDCRHRGSKWT